MTGNSGLCFLIADGEHARFVAADADNVLRTMRSFNSASAHLATHELEFDGAGRDFESARPSSQGVAPRHWPHQMEKLRFADFVADEAGIAAGEGAFDRLVLVALADCLKSNRGFAGCPYRLDGGRAAGEGPGENAGPRPVLALA